ncbi:uroporphyrinogen-III C-methyltransferase [Microbacter sp. GSS18]|nr:uroporphyrinogen-III C-methyltransferase [Microbacter sp. GSS18]
MNLDLDLTDVRVLVVGDIDGVRPVQRRYAAAGARTSFRDPDGALSLLGSQHAPDVVVWVGERDAAHRALAARARSRGILVVVEPRPLPGGRVTLIGGGPGRADLITVAGRDALRQADVVLYDRLGPGDDLDLLAPGAQLVDVGKTPGHHAVPQHEINRMLVTHARAGRRVVRLKGGDPFVFGRGGEEVMACRDASVPVTVVPGISSAIAVPAVAGIPVTHREVSRTFTVISGHVPFGEDELAHLVGLGGTIVVLMGVANLPAMAAGLLRHGMSPAMPLGIVESGFRDAQRTTVADLGAVTEVLTRVRPRSPAVIVIGEVVRALGPETWKDVASSYMEADSAASPRS